MKANLAIAARYAVLSHEDNLSFSDVIEEFILSRDLADSPIGIGSMEPDIVFIAILQRDYPEDAGQNEFPGRFWIDTPTGEQVAERPLNIEFGDQIKCRITARFNGLPFYGVGDYRMNVECKGAVASWLIRVLLAPANA